MNGIVGRHARVRAARLIEHGKALQVQQVELPTPADDEVLVELAYAGVNPVDGYNAAGRGESRWSTAAHPGGGGGRSRRRRAVHRGGPGPRLDP